MATRNAYFEKTNILGIEIDNCSLSELIDYLNNCIVKKTKVVVYGTSLASIGKLKWMPELLEYWEKSDINIVDGGGLKFLDFLFDVKFKEHIGLPNVADNLLELAELNKYKLLLVGGANEVNAYANRNIKNYSQISPFFLEKMVISMNWQKKI